MNSERNKRINAIAGLATLILIAVACLSLALTCIYIYKTGGDVPFSRERVADHAAFFLPQMILAVISLITAFVLSLVFPTEKCKLIGEKNEYIALKRIKATAANMAPSVLSSDEVKRRGKRRIIYVSVYSAITLAFIIFALIFSIDPSKYGLEDINGDIAAVSAVILPSSIAVMILGYITDKLCRRSASIETEMIKARLKSEKLEKSEENETSVGQCTFLSKFKAIVAFFEKPIVQNVLRLSILAVAVVLVIAGIANGGMSDVLGKAVRICTECIGLG